MTLLHYTCRNEEWYELNAGQPAFENTGQRAAQIFGGDDNEEDETVVWRCEACGMTVGVEGADTVYI